MAFQVHDPNENTLRPPQVKAVVVMGPTATGKTELAVRLARAFSGEIVSADSRQVYRGLDIGSGKDLAEYTSHGERPVRYHLIDVVYPDEEYNLFRYVADARQTILAINERGSLPVIAGGTPLYLNALLEGYRLEGGEPDAQLRKELEAVSDEGLVQILKNEAPDVLARTDLTQRRRLVRAVEIAKTRTAAPSVMPLHFDSLLIAPYYPRKQVHRRIEERLDARLKAGMIEEVQELHKRGLSWERLDYFGLEYRYVAQYLQGKLSQSEMREILLQRIRRFCKSQDIWFRKIERAGHVIYWIPDGDKKKVEALVKAFLNDSELPEPEIRLKDVLYGPKSG